jgi:hypothetical protein
VKRPHVIAALLLAAALCLIYLPDIGHGFLRDDYRWLHAGRMTTAADLPRLFTTDLGFYRPIVLASFSLNYALFGLAPWPYAATNLLLLVLGATLIVRLAQGLGLSTTAGFIAAAAWVFNFHAVGMALLWISGRTALLLCVFALLATLATLRRQRWPAAGWCLLALLSKEEAVMLPLLLTWLTWSEERRPARVMADSWPLLAALLAYFALRLNSHAMWPADAPSYYQFTFAPAAILRNVLEYLHRSSTMSAAITLLTALACRRVPGLDEYEWRVVRFGVAWLIASFALTIFLPVRSDLYALTPSVGPCLVCGALVHALLRLEPRRALGAVAAIAVLIVLLIPVYRMRNERWVEPAELSSRLLAQLRDTGELRDVPQREIDTAFEGHLPDAIALLEGR